MPASAAVAKSVSEPESVTERVPIARLHRSGDSGPDSLSGPDADAGPDPDLDTMRMRLAVLLEGVDAYTEVFDPYVDPPELAPSLLSDDLTSIATSLAHGLRHFRAGRVDEALWWWQFSYVSSWGHEASGALRALQSVVSHDRLDAEFESEQDQVAAADALLESANP